MTTSPNGSVTYSAKIASELAFSSHKLYYECVFLTFVLISLLIVAKKIRAKNFSRDNRKGVPLVVYIIITLF
jgi:hypothetical protein